MELILSDKSKASEASALGETGRMHQLLFEQNNSMINDPNFRLWHINYFIPLMGLINNAYGQASIKARLGDFPGNVPPWFDAELSDWNNGVISFPPGLHKGAKVSFAYRLFEKKRVTRTDEDALAEALRLVEEDCRQDNYWDRYIIWPSN